MEEEKIIIELTRHELNTLTLALNEHSGYWLRKAQNELDAELEKVDCNFSRFNTYMSIVDESAELFTKIMNR